MQTRSRPTATERPFLCVAMLLAACTAGLSTTVLADAPVTSSDSQSAKRTISPADMVRMPFPSRGTGGAEVVQAFVARYRAAKGVPEIAGAYVDAEQQKLVVVGPAEAEPYIHGLMAMWDCELAGIPGNSSLKVQKLRLVNEYRELIELITELEIAQVDNDSPKIAERIEAFSAELEKVKRKLEIVEKRQSELDEFERTIGSRSD